MQLPSFASGWALRLARWPAALACAALLAAIALLPGLAASGLWEPQERQAADRGAPRRELATVGELDTMVRNAVAAATAPKPPNAPPPAIVDDKCPKTAPHDAVARSLATRAAQWGRDALGDSDAGRRLPFALLGLVCVLATCGIAMRTAGARAGLLSTLILLAMPLCALQARMLTSEIGTAAGGALIVYALVALGQPRKLGALAILDAALAIAALAGGLAIGFAAGGALLGLVVPLGAVAAAGALGAPAVATIARAKLRALRWLVGKVRPRWLAGRREMGSIVRGEAQLGEQLVALVATLAVIALAGVLAYQLFDLKEPQPGLTPAQREVLDKAIVPSGCWSTALGGIWKAEDDLRYVYDSTFEQIAYGTFPWGVLAPLAFVALLASADRGRRRLGALALAWAGGAWIAGEAFSRKVGFSLYAGFPAMAAATGAWLDGWLAERATQRERQAPSPTALLVGLYCFLAVLVLGKDMQSFADRLPSITVGGDVIAYPTMARLAHVPPKLWVLVLGAIVALGVALAAVPRRRLANGALAALLGGTVLLVGFWPYAWQPVLARHLSSKAMFDTFLELRAPGDRFVMMGDLGDAPHDYAPEVKPEVVTTREQLVAALGAPQRVFAISPQTELCQLHRDLSGKPYYVIDDRNTRSLLLSNKVDGTTDKNPLATQILHAEPKSIPVRPKGRIVFDSRIELIGWSVPKSVSRGSRFEVTSYYKVLQPVVGNWKVLFHFDGALRFNGDHDPINGRCQTATWQPGDYIVDTTTVVAGGGTFAPGPYEVWTGFFTGAAPNWKNMPISEAPSDMRDTADRVKITTINLD